LRMVPFLGLPFLLWFKNNGSRFHVLLTI
jgi:hypothetical protein